MPALSAVDQRHLAWLTTLDDFRNWLIRAA